MQVRCCTGGRLVFPTEPSDLDAEADGIDVGDETDVIDAVASLQPTGGGCAIDDLIGGGFDVVGRGEVEDRVGRAGARVEGKVLAGTRRVEREVFSGTWGIRGKVFTSAGWVVDSGEILSFLDGTGKGRDGEEGEDNGDLVLEHGCE